jgi:hypothetical protein
LPVVHPVAFQIVVVVDQAGVNGTRNNGAQKESKMQNGIGDIRMVRYRDHEQTRRDETTHLKIPPRLMSSQLEYAMNHLMLQKVEN